jgi:hypothetical protein
MMQAITGYVREAAPEKTAPKKAAVATCRGAQLGLGLLLLLGTAAAAETAGGGAPQIAAAAFGAGAWAAAETFDPPDPDAAMGAAVDAVAGGTLDVPPFASSSEAAVIVPAAAKVAESAGADVLSAAKLTTACTGSSTNLPLDQCDAWIKFYDALTGDGWISSGGDACKGLRTDPCACKGVHGKTSVCNNDGTTVVNLCVRSLASPSACAALK